MSEPLHWFQHLENEQQLQLAGSEDLVKSSLQSGLQKARFLVSSQEVNSPKRVAP